MGIGVAGMIITSDYGSFPHSLRLAPVRKLRLWEAQILILCSILRCSKSSDSRTRRCHMSWRAFGLALDSVVLLWVMRSAEGTTSRLRTDRVLGFPLSEHPTVWGKLLLHLRAPTVAGTALWYCQAANSSQRNRRRIGKSVDCLQDGEGPQLIIPCSWALRGACRKRGERVGRGRAVSSSLQHWDLQISSKVRRPFQDQLAMAELGHWRGVVSCRERSHVIPINASTQKCPCGCGSKWKTDVGPQMWMSSLVLTIQLLRYLILTHPHVTVA